MNSKNLFLYIVIIFFIFLTSCAENEVNENEVNKIFESVFNQQTDSAFSEKMIKIFYKEPSPLEMATLMQRTNGNFYKDLLSNTVNIERFSTSADMALNIGVYGVDLSYAKIFNKNQEALNSLGALKELSSKIGIPDEHAASVFTEMEKNIATNDSLLVIINRTYSKADQFLKDNDRRSTATLIITGGWIEALYIATNIYNREENHEDILERIVVQKFSLNTLIQLLSENQNDKTVTVYLKKLLLLKKVYDKIEINFINKEIVEVDKVNKVITIKGNEALDITNEELDNIATIVASLRNAIVKNK
jgi:hypothetical protein